MRLAIAITAVVSGSLLNLGATSVHLVFAQSCTITFDATCPTIVPECGASFSGGLGCGSAGLGDCYHSGTEAYGVDSSSPLIITLDAAISELAVFFAHTGSIQGTMRFFDAPSGGTEVGTPLMTNGDCSLAMPPTQSTIFATSVLRIEVTTTGNLWIDTMTLTPAPSTPTESLSWGMLKARY